MDAHTLFRLRASEIRDFMRASNTELADFNNLVASQPDTPLLRRLKVRVVFSLIEAQIYQLKYMAITHGTAGQNVFDDEEVLELQEYWRDKKGGLKRARVPMQQSIKHAFDAMAMSLGRTYQIDFGSDGGKNFMAAVAIRDRITHPKSMHSWTISDADHKAVEDAWCWFGQHLVNVTEPPK